MQSSDNVEPRRKKSSPPGRSSRAASAIQSLGSHRSEEHTSELQSPCNLVCRLLLEKKKHTPDFAVFSLGAHYGAVHSCRHEYIKVILEVRTDNSNKDLPGQATRHRRRTAVMLEAKESEVHNFSTRRMRKTQGTI